MENEELDLTNKKWVLSEDISLGIINQMLMDNYPEVDLAEELEKSNYKLEDLLDDKKLVAFLSILNGKYPEE